jgi:hypothetical protein
LVVVLAFGLRRGLRPLPKRKKRGQGDSLADEKRERQDDEIPAPLIVLTDTFQRESIQSQHLHLLAMVPGGLCLLVSKGVPEG